MNDGSEGKRLRKRAEKKLSEQREAPPKTSFGDMEKLIHELKVHQIELEMQNDELRKAQAEIEESRSRYVDLYDFAPVGYFTLDNTGAIVEANLTGAGLLGIERKLLPRTPFLHFIIPEDRGQFLDYRRKVFRSAGRQSCELRLNRKGENSLWVRLEGEAVEPTEGKLAQMRMAASDITERKLIAEALQQAHNELERRVEERTVELRAALSEIKTMKDSSRPRIFISAGK